MTYKEYKKTIEREASRLSQTEKVALCIKCCERLAPLYSIFSKTENWGDESILFESRQLAKAWLQGEKADSASLRVKFDSIIPDSDDFGSVLGSYAQNASIAHAYMLDQLNTEDMQPLLWVLGDCYSTIDFYVQELLDPNLEGNLSDAQIESHELMISEINWQIDQLIEVKSHRNLSKFLVDKGNAPTINVA